MCEIGKYSTKILRSIVVSIWTIVLVINIFINDYICKLEVNRIANIAIFFMGLIIWKLFFEYVRNKELKIQKYQYHILVIGMVITVLLQILICRGIYGEIGWDVSMVKYRAMHEEWDRITYSYFSTYQNNLGILAFYIVLFKLFNTNDLYSFGMILCVINIIAVNIGTTLVYRLVKKILGIKSAMFTYFTSIIMVALSPWIIVMYTDVIAIPLFWIVANLIYEIININKKSEKNRNDILCQIVLGIFSVVIVVESLKVKPTTIIPYIAIVIIALITQQIKVNKAVLIILLGIMCTFWGTSKLLDKAIIEITQIDEMPLDNSIKFSIEHYFMMGNGGEHGSFSDEDYVYSMNLDRDIRRSENLRVGIERIKERGFFGYVRFALEKVRWVMSEGNFHWLGEGNFIDTGTNPNNDLISKAMREIFFADGKCYALYIYTIQFIWEIVQVLCILSLIKDKSVYTNFLACTIFAVWLYQILFEARSRYLILFIPFFIVLASFNLKEESKEGNKDEMYNVGNKID